MQGDTFILGGAELTNSGADLFNCTQTLHHCQQLAIATQGGSRRIQTKLSSRKQLLPVPQPCPKRPFHTKLDAPDPSLAPFFLSNGVVGLLQALGRTAAPISHALQRVLKL